MLAIPAGALGYSSGDQQSNMDSFRGFQTQEDQRIGTRHSNGSWWQWWWKHKHQRSDDQLSCEERQEAVNQQVEDKKTSKQRYLDLLAIYYTSTQTYVDDQSLDVDNYEQLKANVDAAQADASTALSEVETPEVDCERSERHDRRQVKQAFEEFSEALQDYHFDLFKLVQAVTEAEVMEENGG